MKQQEPNNSNKSQAQQQIKKLEDQKSKTDNPALKEAIDKKIELLKTGKDIQK